MLRNQLTVPMLQLSGVRFTVQQCQLWQRHCLTDDTPFRLSALVWPLILLDGTSAHIVMSDNLSHLPLTCFQNVDPQQSQLLVACGHILCYG